MADVYRLVEWKTETCPDVAGRQTEATYQRIVEFGDVTSGPLKVTIEGTSLPVKCLTEGDYEITIRRTAAVASNHMGSSTVHDILSAYLSGGRGNRLDEPNEGADSLIEMLSDCGFAIVPREPTKEMCSEGGFSLERRLHSFGPMNERHERATNVWQAMIDTAMGLRP